MKKKFIIMPVEDGQELHVNIVGHCLIFTLVHWEFGKRRLASHSVEFSKLKISSQTGDKQAMANQIGTLINYLQVLITRLEFEQP